MTNITPLDFDPNRRDPDRRLHLRGVPEDRGQRYQGVGNEFAAARLQTGMDIGEVATALRIRKEHLSAIEEGRFADLPAPAYALGFVRSYADYLGLDPAAAVEAFKQETSNCTACHDFLSFEKPVPRLLMRAPTPWCACPPTRRWRRTMSSTPMPRGCSIWNPTPATPAPWSRPTASGTSG